MKEKLIEENGEYELECKNALWASDQMHEDYHKANIPLTDADFLLEDEKNIMIVEYKNSNIQRARAVSYKTPAFNPMEDNKIGNVVRKFYDSLHYVHLLGKTKPVQYVYIVETPNSDSTMRKRLREKIKVLLPFKLQDNMNTGIKLIEGFEVLSIDEWNKHEEYGKFPLVKVNERKG
jgi:hypothetical protein